MARPHLLGLGWLVCNITDRPAETQSAAPALHQLGGKIQSPHIQEKDLSAASESSPAMRALPRICFVFKECGALLIALVRACAQS